MRVLVLGAAGMLGHIACRVLGGSHEVWATARRPLTEIPGGGAFYASCKDVGPFDAGECSNDAIDTLLKRAGAEVVVNCIGIVKQLKQASDPVISIEINSLFPHRLALVCSRNGAKMIQISTDCVFSGRNGMYDENDIPDPVDLYGRSKLLGEVTGTEHLTIRTSIIGRQLGAPTGLLEWLRSNRNGETNGFAKAIFSGLSTIALADILSSVISEHPDLKGLYHLASSPISKYDLLLELNDRLRLGITIHRDDTFTCDRSLKGGKFLSETGIEVPSHEYMIQQIAEDEQHDG